MPSFDRETAKVNRPSSGRGLPLRASPRWVYAAHPLSWEVQDVDGVDRWVPRLRLLTIRPGVNGVNKNGDTRDYFFALQNEGWTIIDNGGPAGEYQDEVYCKTGGTAWLDRWCTPHEYAPGRVKIRRTEEQRAAFAKWRAGLVDAGALPKPDPILLEEVIERYEDTHIRRNLSRELEPSIGIKIEKARAAVERMRGAKVEAPEPPKTKRAR